MFLLVGLIDAIPIIGVGIAMYLTFVDPFAAKVLLAPRRRPLKSIQVLSQGLAREH
jgi:hypothetical protein